MTTSRFEDAAASPGLLMWRVTLRWQRHMRAALGGHGLTHVQFVLLASTWWLGGEGQPPTQRGIADHAGTDPMMTSQVLRALERQRLVARTADRDDGRAMRVRITPEGEARLGPALRDVEATDAEFFASADPAFILGLTHLAAR